MKDNIALPDVSQDIRDAISKEIVQYPVRSNWASKLGHPCLRYLVHSRLDWQKAPMISVTTKMLFNGGNIVEQHIAKVYLEKAGFQIVEQARPINWEEKQIGGRLDFIIRRKDLPDEIPVEVKTMEHHSWEKINTIEDFLFSKKSWHKTYPGQLTIYMLQKGKELGMFLLVSKRTYEPKHIWVNLDYTYAEELIQKSEKINECVKRKDYPERIPYDSATCARCDYALVCLPDVIRKGINMLDNTELEEKLERRETLDKYRLEYKELDDEIKQPYKDREDEANDVVGTDWRILSTKTKGKKVDVKLLPEKIVKKYQQPTVSTRVNIIDLRKEKK